MDEKYKEGVEEDRGGLRELIGRACRPAWPLDLLT